MSRKLNALVDVNELIEYTRNFISEKYGVGDLKGFDIRVVLKRMHKDNKIIINEPWYNNDE